MNWFYINAGALAAIGTLVSSIAAIASVFIARTVARWARVQADAAKATVKEMQQDRRDQWQPVLVPVGAPPDQISLVPFTAFDIVNYGTGPALNILVRLYRSSLGECHAEGLSPGQRTQISHWHGTRTSVDGFLPYPRYQDTTLVEIIFNDIFQQWYRTMAHWDLQDQRWAEVKIDQGGDRQVMLIDSKYFPERVEMNGHYLDRDRYRTRSTE